MIFGISLSYSQNAIISFDTYVDFWSKVLLFGPINEEIFKTELTLN